MPLTPKATAVPASLTPLPLASQGTIFAFARCLNHQNQGYLCGWRGPTESIQWLNFSHDFFQDSISQMGLDFQPAAVYEPVERKIHVFGLSAGNLHWLTCDASAFARDLSCGPDRAVSSLNNVRFAPSAVTLEDGSVFAFFNGGNELYFVAGRGGVFSQEMKISKLLADGGEAAACGAVDLSPSAIVRSVAGGGQEIHVFAMASGHRLLHAYRTAEGLGQVLQDPGKKAWHCETLDGVILNNSPKAFVDPGNGVINIAAIDSSNRPEVWRTTDAGEARLKASGLGPIANVTVRMPWSETLGVATVANAGGVSTFHVFYRLGDGSLGHVTTRSGEPHPEDPEAAGIGMSVINSPAAVSDPAGNLHVFAGVSSSADYSYVGQCGKNPQGEWQCNRQQTYVRDFGTCHYADPDGFHRWDRDCDPREHGDLLQATYYDNVLHSTDGYSGMSVLFVPVAFGPGN